MVNNLVNLICLIIWLIWWNFEKANKKDIQLTFLKTFSILIFKIAVTDKRYFSRSHFSRILTHKKNVCLIWQAVCQVRIRILSREVGYFIWVEWTSRKVADHNKSRKIRKQVMIKFSFTYSFLKIFFISQNLKHFQMTYSFLEFLVFYSLNLVDIYCLEFISPHTK